MERMVAGKARDWLLEDESGVAGRRRGWLYREEAEWVGAWGVEGVQWAWRGVTQSDQGGAQPPSTS
jgi:hypothetical protein